MQEREPDSSTSSSNAKGKGKSKEEDYDKTGNSENKENKTAVIDRHNNVHKERKNELQATELLNKMDELRKEMHDLAKTISESGISLPAGRKQPHGRSGVDSAGKTSRTETGKPSPSEESGSRRERPHVRYVAKHRGDHHAGILGHARGYGSYIQGHKDGKM